ncbi:MAG: hypothetical protein JWO82_3011, partial [Akkermansiaceae bacterium]|nr:hypothetical protein [Akkermansiaceae bacterium]
YEGRPLPAIAAAMGMGEHAVRKRALRALEKLRVLFQKRGISTTASALGVLLPMHASAAVPAGLATSVSSAALAVAPAAGSGAFFSFIAMTTTTKLAAGLAAIAAIAAVTVTLRHFPSGNGGSASASGKSSQVAGNAQPAPAPRHAAPGTRPADSDLSRFQAILRLTGPAEREARLSGYFASLSASSFAALVPRFAELGIIPDSAEAKGFYLAWAKLDPGAALISARFINPALAGVLMTGWMREDQEAAIAWATSQTDLNGNPNPAFVKMVLPSLAILDPQRAVGLLQHLPSDPATAEYQDWVVRDAGLGGAIYEIVSALQNRPERLKELISSIADPALRRKAALAALQEFSGASAMMSDGNLVRATVSGDSPAVRAGQAIALAWLAEEPGLAVGFSVSNLFHEVAAGDPQQALTALDRLPAGSSARGAAVSGMVTSIVDRSGPAAGLSFLDQHPDDVTPDALREWRYQSEKKDPALVMENASRFGDGTGREEVIGRTLQIWQRSDPAAAEAWMRIHPDDAGRQSAWEKNHLTQEPLSGN